MSFVRSLFLDRIGGQIAMLILVSLLAIHGVITVSLYVGRLGERFEPPYGGPAELAAVVRTIAAEPEAERPQAIARAAVAFPGLHLASAAPLPAESDTASGDRHIRFLAHALGPAFRVAAPPAINGRSDMVVIALPDSGGIAASLAAMREPPMIAGPIAMTAMFVVISVSLLGLWAARSLRSPLSAFAQAAENFSLDGKAAATIAPLPERGPQEVRAVARALNRMRDRIRALVDDRTRLFAAMSHDLRTPITRLRLRCEFVADPELRGQMLRDLDQMKTMTESVLSFLRDGQSREPMEAVDLASSLQTVCDQFADMGHSVGYEGPAHRSVIARASELQRAVINLTNNAVRHGTRTVIRLRDDDNGPGVCIDVLDNGPGIPDARKLAMLEPFARGDEARNLDGEAGFGLGLAIARAIAEAHGGALSLHDGAPGGLIARITLPARPPAARLTGPPARLD